MNRSNDREAAVWTRFNATAGPLEGESDERARGGWERAVIDLGRGRVRRRVGIGGTGINAQVVHRLAIHADHQARAT
jgi:hypothetical protein